MSTPKTIINNLSPEDALIILKQLATQDEKLAAEIAALAVTHLSNVDIDEIASALLYDLEQLTPEDVWERSGKTRYGYVEPYEAANELFEEVLEPYLDEVRRCQKAELYLEAEQRCAGLLLGLYRFEFEVKNDFKDWGTDLPLDYARSIMAIWQQGNENRDTFEEFIQLELPHWQQTLLPH